MGILTTVKRDTGPLKQTTVISVFSKPCTEQDNLRLKTEGITKQICTEIN